MSMNFTEFKRLLGAEPRSTDPAILSARKTAPEFEAAATEAEQLEDLIEQALSIPVPDGLIEDIVNISRQAPAHDHGRHWLPMALAASFLIAVGVAGVTWNLNRGWSSVEEYVIDHYRHDGDLLPAAVSAEDVQSLFSGLDTQAAPALASIVGVIKYCPTPDGKGIHMILNTESGPVTVIYMPETRVTDREQFAFDDVDALLVSLGSGSAAIIGPDEQSISNLYAFVQDSIIPSPDSS